jgi:hypothetical protein
MVARKLVKLVKTAKYRGEETRYLLDVEFFS